jgi:hypothetical protein
LSLSLLTGCGAPTTSPVDSVDLSNLTPQLDHKPNHGKGGGGNPGSGNDFAAGLTFRDAPTDSITSDGGAPYTDGVRIRSDGILLWNTDPRVFNVALGPLGDPAGCGADCLLDFDSNFSTTGALRVLASPNNDDELPDHLLGMAEGDTLWAMLRTRLGDFEKSGPVFQLRFQFPVLEDSDAPINPEIDAASSYLNITRKPGNTWTIWTTASPDDLALVFSQTGRGKKTYRDEGSYHVPFEMTVTCAACPGGGS